MRAENCWTLNLSLALSEGWRITKAAKKRKRLNKNNNQKYDIVA